MLQFYLLSRHFLERLRKTKKKSRVFGLWVNKYTWMYGTCSRSTQHWNEAFGYGFVTHVLPELAYRVQDEVN